MHVTATYDGSLIAAGAKLYIDGREVDTVAELDYSNTDMKTKAPFRIGTGADADSGFVGSIDEIVVYDRDLKSEEVLTLAVAKNLSEIAQVRSGERTEDQKKQARVGFRRSIRASGSTGFVGGAEPVEAGQR